MNAHKNARLMPHSRTVLVRRVLEDGQPPKAAAATFGVCRKTAAKWTARFRTEGIASLQDRSSRLHKLRHPTPECIIRRTEALRRQRWTGQRTATELGISPSTVSRTLRRLRLGRIKDIEPFPPPRRYERSRLGEMIHFDIKKSGCFKAPEHRITEWHTGMHRSGGAVWEYLHVCIYDRFRMPFSAVMPDETTRSAIAFFQAAVAYYQNFGITIERIMTNNGPCYTSKVFRNLCTDLGIRHIRTRPCTSKTNGNGGTIHTNSPQEIGLCSRLSDLHATTRPASSLTSSLQLAPASQQS